LQPTFACTIQPPTRRFADASDHPKRPLLKRGAIAQLGERFNGIEEVVGSIPSGSTKKINNLACGTHAL
jgi:hypothetical protein